jgi:hypothetical protein
LPRKARSAESLEGFLALALVPPAAAKDDRPVEVRVRALLEELREIEAKEPRNLNADDHIYREMWPLIAHETESHLALMDLLREAENDAAASNILEFLVWNPWVSSGRDEVIAREIHASARGMIEDDPSLVRREAAVRVLYRYGGGGGRSAFDFGLARLEVEPALEIRDVLLEEMSVMGKTLGLTREEAAPFVERLRTRLEEGIAWCAVSLSWWSTDEADFRRISEKLASDRRPRHRQTYLRAISGEALVVRDRTAEARALLVGVMNDPTESDLTRGVARDYLAESFGPVDAETAEVIRRFDAEQGGR